MDKLKKIELEMRELPLELRKMRMQKYELNQEVNKLTHEKFRIAENANKSRKEIISLGEEINILRKEVSKIKALCKNEEAKLIKVTREIDEKLEKPQLLNVEVEEKQKRLLKGIAKLDQDKAEIRAIKEALERDGIKIKRKDAELKRKIEEVANSNIGVRRTIVSYDKKIADLNLEKDKVASQLDKAKELNNTLAVKIKKADGDNILLKEKIKLNDRRSNLLEAQKEQYEKRLIDVAQDKKMAKEAKANYEKALIGLNDREKEIAIVELKIKKGIRSKEIEKELKELSKTT